MFDRFDIAEAYYVYAQDYGLYGLFDRIERIPFKARPSLKRSTLTENGQRIYAGLRLAKYHRKFSSVWDRKPDRSRQ